jgi:hypothetical protein
MSLRAPSSLFSLTISAHPQFFGFNAALSFSIGLAPSVADDARPRCRRELFGAMCRDQQGTGGSASKRGLLDQVALLKRSI